MTHTANGCADRRLRPLPPPGPEIAALRRLDQRWFPARKAPVTDITFSTLGVPAPLVAALAADGKTSPFPIQVDTLPDTLAGRDVLGRGKTGSGKTLAFSIPMVARLGGALAGGKRRPGRPLGLVLAPTRELATQIDAVLAAARRRVRPEDHHDLRRRQPEPPGRRAARRRRHRRRLPRAASRTSCSSAT